MGLLEYRDFGISGEDSDICIDLISGFLLMPGVRGRDWIVPKLDGRQHGNRRKDTLVLPLAGFVRGTGSDAQSRREDFFLNLQALMAVMDPSADPGTLRLSNGYLGVPSGEVATIEARVRNSSPGRMQSGQAFQLWTFELEAPSPEWEFGT